MNISNPLGLESRQVRIVIETCDPDIDDTAPGIEYDKPLPAHTLHFVIEGFDPRGIVTGVLAPDGTWAVAPHASMLMMGGVLAHDRQIEAQHTPDIEFVDPNDPPADLDDPRNLAMAIGPDGQLMPIPPRVLAAMKEAIRKRAANKDKEDDNRPEPSTGQYL